MRRVMTGEALMLLQRSLAAALPFAVLPFLTTSPGHAELRVCNKTASRVGIALGYKSERDWTTEGWWTVDADSCATLLAGPLVSR